MIRVRVNSKAARDRVLRVQRALTPAAIDPVVERAAFESQARLIRSTPKRWFGQVRRGWVVVKPGDGRRVVTNQNPIMLFLEEGTRPHGPREIYGPLVPGQPRRKAALFVPLTRKAANATQGIYGVGFAPVAKPGKNFVGPVAHVRAIFQRTQTVRRGKTRVGQRALLYGQDYVLAKRVRGIRAMKIVAKEKPRARARFLRLMQAHIRAAIRGPVKGR